MSITLLTRAGLTLLIEGGLACLLAAILGYLFWRSKNAALTLSLTTLVANIFLLLVLSFAFDPDQLPFHHLDPQMTKFSDNVAPYLVNIYLILEIAMWTTAMAGALGYFFVKEMGAVMLTGVLTIATAFCVIMTAAPFYIFGMSNTTWALVIAVALVGTAGIWLFTNALVQGKGAVLFTLLWFELLLACWIGYQVAGRIGLLLITLPAQAIFWGALYYLSILSLPIPDHEKIPTLLNLLPFDEEVESPVWGSLFSSAKDDARTATFRSVLTSSMGTNYPYYVIEDWKTRETMDKEKPDPNVNGNPFRQFFAGPGIILCNCDHLAVTSDGIKFRVCPPGLSFTGQFEQLYTDVDLRPQLRVTTITAETKDGITAKIFTFMPNRVWADGRKVQLGSSYPFNEDAVINAVYNHSVMEHKFDRDENQLATEEVTRRPWHELVLTMGPPLLKDVVANYTCNELHMETQDPDKPKYELAQEYSQADITAVNEIVLSTDVKLQQFMARRLDEDELKDLAFDASVNYTLFTHQTEEELSQALVQHFANQNALGCLAHQIQRHWPSKYIARLFPRPIICALPIKVQVLLATDEGSRINLGDLQGTLAAHFDVAVKQITIIGAAKRSLRVLVGVPEDAVNLRVLSEIHPHGDEKCTLISLTIFESLSREMQRAWRYACCSTPPTITGDFSQGDFLQPEIAWDDALEASRIRNPRAEIGNTFIRKLKEEMKPLGIEVIGGGISDIKVPDDITAQRIKNWEVEREKDIEIAVAEAKARIALREQEVRAEVRLEMLTRLTQILQEAERGVNKRILAARLFDAMGIHPQPDPKPQSDNALQQAQNGDRLPPYMLEMLKNIGN